MTFGRGKLNPQHGVFTLRFHLALSHAASTVQQPNVIDALPPMLALLREDGNTVSRVAQRQLDLSAKFGGPEEHTRQKPAHTSDSKRA
jgi:hypothetical protein